MKKIFPVFSYPVEFFPSVPPVFSVIFSPLFLLIFLMTVFCPLFANQNSFSLEQNALLAQVGQTESQTAAEQYQQEQADFQTERENAEEKRNAFRAGDRRFVDDEQANDLLTPLERYANRTQVNIFRRTEAIFFIGIPFAIFINYSLKSSFSLFSAMAAAMEEAPSDVRIGEFNYFHENTPAGTLDPFYVYTWTSNIVWPLVIALNDVIERTTSDEYTLKQKQDIRRWRFDADLMHTDF